MHPAAAVAADAVSSVTTSTSKWMSNSWRDMKYYSNGYLGSVEDPPDPHSNQLPETSYFDEFHEATSLTHTQRLYGFLMAIGMGIVFFLIAISFLPTIALFPKKFAFFFTCGNVFLLLSTVFIVGWRKQLEVMFESHRLQAAALYFGAMFMTLASALHWQSSVLAIIFASVQLISALWYVLSFIPSAQRLIKLIWSYASIVLVPLLTVFGKGVWMTLSTIVSCCCKR